MSPGDEPTNELAAVTAPVQPEVPLHQVTAPALVVEVAASSQLKLLTT